MLGPETSLLLHFWKCLRPSGWISGEIGKFLETPEIGGEVSGNFRGLEGRFLARKGSAAGVRRDAVTQEAAETGPA